jgi:recombination protein RecA
LGKKRKRQRQLDIAVSMVHHRYGPHSLFRGQPPPAFAGAPHISTGFPALDRALGMSGLPKGSLCELLGPATSGKTTLALKFLAQAQAASPGAGGQVAVIDQAGYFDPDYAHRCGLDLSRLLVGKPADWQEALAMTEALVRSSSLVALIFDALDFFWIESGVSQAPLGQAAHQFSAFLSRLVAPLARSETILLFLHEPPSATSSPLSALAHYAAVRLQVVRERWVQRHDPSKYSGLCDVRGYEVRVEVLKNRMGPTGRAVTLTIEFNGTVRGDGL